MYEIMICYALTSRKAPQPTYKDMTMKKVRFYAIISLIITLLVGCQPTFQVNVGIEPTPIPNDLGKLAYIQGGDIWVKTLPDGEPQRLTQDGNNSEPRWSPSGKWLAFRKGDFSVYLIDERGTAIWPSNNGTTVDSYAWSPVTDNLAYASGGEIYTVEADGKNMMQLIPTGEGNQNNETQIGRLFWEPDGSSIAYEWREQPENQPPSGQGIRLISLDGSKPREIFQGDATLAGWTEDGQYLLFWRGLFSSASLAADGLPLFAVSIEGGTPVSVVDIMLTYQDYVSINPTSTDQFLVVTGGGRDAWTNKILMLQRSSGGEGSALTSTDMAVSSPAWSPDGSKIAYVASPDPGGQGMLQGEAARQTLMRRRIYIINQGGQSNPKQLTNDAAYQDERPIWSNDGGSILFARFNQENQASLWLVTVADGKTTQVVDQLTPNPEWFGYYGHVEWDTLYDWWKGEAVQLPVQASTTESVEWKNYKSPSYGFSINYPSDLTLKEQSISPGIALWLSFTSPDDPGDPIKYEPPFGLIVYENPGHQLLIDWFTAHVSDPPEYGQPPKEVVAFYSPIIENQDEFQGHKALQYESGAWPARYEKLIEQDGWVIGLYYHREHPFDYGTVYEKVLASLELTQPSSTPVVTPTVIPRTPVPVVCLDEHAKPESVPPREQPLEVRFISDGNIWMWEEKNPARQITATNDAIRFTVSPDGEVIAFERVIGDYPGGQFKAELWAINRDGSNLRRLESVEQFDTFLPGRHEAWVANLPTDLRWFAGTHQLSFGVYPWINAVGSSNTAEGYWIIDTDTLVLEQWVQPEKIDPYGPKEILSPDNKLIALIDRESISLLNADGSSIRKNILSYQVNSAGEGPGWSPPKVVWSPDSLTLKVLVWEGDPASESFSTWEIPADGSQAEKLHTFSGIEHYSYISPNQGYIAYQRRMQDKPNDHELHLAKFDGSTDVIYDTGYQLYFQGWAPDSFHFVYDLFTTHQPQLGSICGGHSELVDKSQTPAMQITWVDANRFLFVAGQEGQPRQLYLGKIKGESLLIGPFNGQWAYFQVRKEGEDVIMM
jgi:Tol biopolymer transport system component